MSTSTRPLQRSLVVPSLALLVAGAAGAAISAFDALLHEYEARAFARPSRSHGVVLVAVDEATRRSWGEPPWAAALTEELAAEIERGGPRLVIWPEEQVAEDRSSEPALGLDPGVGPTLLRARDPGFPGAALAALGARARHEPLPVRFASGLPTVSAQRVLAGGIPASTFRDRVVVIGRDEPALRSVDTPLGAMSPAQIEAHALLGVVDGARWIAPPWWLRVAMLVGWAFAVARLLRDCALREMLGFAALAAGAALVVDAALFAAGVMRLGVAAPVVVVMVVAVATHLGTRMTRSRVPARAAARMRVPLTTTAVDFHKVSRT
jgi:CHASE2 domain-containing sensor protein